jgi:UDP-N-acetylmuramate--alanine ligase
MKKLRVGVLMGGKSIEREVSFNSGRTICDHLDTTRYAITPLFQAADGKLYILPWHFLHRGKISDFESRLAHEATRIAWDDLKELIDFVYIALHGRYGEDGTVQGMLEILHIPYLGSNVISSALGMDKIKQKEFLQAAGICVPKSITVSAHAIQTIVHDLSALQEQMEHHGITFPCIIKPHKEGSSIGVSVVFSAEELPQALQYASTINPLTPQDVLIEEKIEGMEFSCTVITDYKTGTPLALAPTEVVHKKNTHLFDYEQKYMPGNSHEYTPARTSEKNRERIQAACVATMRALEFTNLARVDGFLTADGTVVIIDPNSLSGMGPASFLFREAAEYNMSHTTVINHLIETELEEYHMLDPLIQEELKHTTDADAKKIRVAVLLGGASNEREISLESGRNVCYKLAPQKYEVIPVFVSSTFELYTIPQKLLVRNSTQEIESLLELSMKIKWNDLPDIADFAFIGLHGGHGENGSVQGALELLGISYNGSGVLTSALCINKYKTNQFLKHKGFAIPAACLVSKKEWVSDKETAVHTLSALSLPLIVKPHDDGCSVMVQKAKTKNDLHAAIDLLFENGKEYALIEECIVGMELTVGVIGNANAQALPPSRAVANTEILSIKEKFLPGAGENQTPAPLPEQELLFVQKTIEQVYTSMNCKGYARIDCFYQNEQQSPTQQRRLVILEVNTLPGLTPATCLFHQAAEVDIKPMELIDRIIQLGLEEHNAYAVQTHTAPSAQETVPVDMQPYHEQPALADI